jgi:hypothetical protein
MGRRLAFFLFESCGQFLVFLGDLGPFLVPALEVEKLDAARHAANIGVGMKLGYLHADFELPATGQTARGKQRFFRLVSIEDFVWHR